jgi:hypothetical protein
VLTIFEKMIVGVPKMTQVAVKKERRTLGMHPKLLMDTIKRQAGSLHKAVLEGCMNAVEAGSPEVNIEFMEEKKDFILTIDDTGRGIVDRKEIEEYFETFGTPHTESENVVWKQFRMGRGQLFSFGKNTWRTSQFKMVVDIKNWGLDYELEEGLPEIKGCQITVELYDNPIGSNTHSQYPSVESFKENVREQVRFFETNVFFDAEQINTAPSTCQWDYEDEYAYYIFNSGTDFSWYNLGAFVMKESAWKRGMHGIAVSKKQLKVNFARNDIQHDCEFFGEMKDVVKKNVIREAKKRTRRTFTDYERRAMLTYLRDGEQEYDEVNKIALIQTAQGKRVTLDYIRKNRQQWTFAPNGDRLADKLMERGAALIFDEDMLEQLGYTGRRANFFNWLTHSEDGYSVHHDEWQRVKKLYVSYEKLTSGISDEYITLPEKKLKTIEKRIIKVLQKGYCWKGRVINLGYSDRANAWTDGQTYITIDRHYLESLYLGHPSHVNKLMMLLAHEMAHDEDTRGTHVHGPDFYENMVRILESNNSPTTFNCTFYKYMQDSRVEERKAKEKAKEAKKQAEVEKKLQRKKTKKQQVAA